MADAWIDGSPVALRAAAIEAAKLLKASRLPVVAGLGTDVDGARAAIGLAAQIGGVIDHMHSQALLRDLDVAREAGMMVTTPNEAALRADTLLMVGPGLETAWPDLNARLIERPPAPEVADRFRRRIFRLCPGTKTRERYAQEAVIGRAAKDLPAVLAALRARLAGRPCRKLRDATAIDRLAAELRAARFGVALWSAAELDVLTIEMLCGLVNDLNRTTRFSGLPLTPGDHAAGVLEVCGWMTGFPMRTGFCRGFPEHDPWRFEASRLVESGEADCALWISAYRAAAPDWDGILPIIALTGADAKFRRRPPRVHIAVGRPGLDHEAVERFAPTGTLARTQAKHQSQAISVAQAIGQIALALASDRASPC
ncbi:MAG TPA: tungsten formylmethanofuran dehydrogenase [Xanthobacteraceae bacterium]|nr:tungsten formylmethanofuran dehydrogenase [Xanthobacteraceae bacterium]